MAFSSWKQKAKPSHSAAYRFYRRLTFQTWLLSTKMLTVWESTPISQLCSQLESELFVRTYVAGANLAVVLLSALATRCWSL